MTLNKARKLLKLYERSSCPLTFQDICNYWNEKIEEAVLLFETEPVLLAKFNELRETRGIEILKKTQAK